LNATSRCWAKDFATCMTSPIALSLLSSSYKLSFITDPFAS
jgi:hypothetical protein